MMHSNITRGIKKTQVLSVFLPLLGLLSLVPFLLGAQLGSWEGSNVGDAQTIPTGAATDSFAILDTDNVAVETTEILEFLGATTAPGGILRYDVEVTYDGTLINILATTGVRGGDVPFDAVPTFNIDNSPTGTTTFSDTTVALNTQSPITLAKLVVKLVGCSTDLAVLSVGINDVRSVDEPSTPIPGDTIAKSLRRGDARADGTVDVSNVLFIAQFLVGLRNAGEDLPGVFTLTHPINGASPKQDTSGDVMNIADALFIAQLLATLRDDCYIVT